MVREARGQAGRHADAARCFRAALEDLEHYLEMTPAAADLDEIRGCVLELRRSAARLN